MAKRVTQVDLIEAYRIALIRWGTYNIITIDTVTRDWCGEIIIHMQGKLMFQGSVSAFQESSKQFL